MNNGNEMRIASEGTLNVLTTSSTCRANEILMSAIVFEHTSGTHLVGLLRLINCRFRMFLQGSESSLIRVIRRTLSLFVTSVNIRNMVQLRLPRRQVLLILSNFVNLMSQRIRNNGREAMRPEFSRVMARLSTLVT